MARYTIQRYCAKNDTNGNPRRVFVVRKLHDVRSTLDGYDWSEVVMTVDEGYGESYRSVVARLFYPTCVYDLGDVDVAPGVYRRMVNYLK